MRKILVAAFLACAGAAVFADELVTNGDFEAGATGWTLGGVAIIGDFSGVDVTSFGGGINGPPTNTAWLGGIDDTDDTITQSINTLAGATATLSFRLYWVNEDFAGFDFLTVTLGGTEVYSQDLGDDQSVQLYGPSDLSFDVSGLMDGSAKDLVFEVTTDESFPCSAFIDDVSIQANVVPEPASLAALGVGALALLRKRRK